MVPHIALLLLVKHGGGSTLRIPVSSRSFETVTLEGIMKRSKYREVLEEKLPHSAHNITWRSHDISCDIKIRMWMYFAPCRTLSLWRPAGHSWPTSFPIWSDALRWSERTSESAKLAPADDSTTNQLLLNGVSLKGLINGQICINERFQIFTFSATKNI